MIAYMFSPINIYTFGDALQEFRHAHGFSLRYTAKHLYMDYSGLSKVENAKTSPAIIIHTFRWDYLVHLLRMSKRESKEIKALGMKALEEWNNGKKKNRQARQRNSDKRGARKQCR
jgi:transcriptional regulator with XRE-family HTH domain